MSAQESPVQDSNDSVPDTLDLLNAPDETPAEDTLPLKPKEEEPKEDEEKLDLAGAKDDEEEQPEIKDDEIEIHAPPARKTILAKYPNIFKDFPILERNLYKAQQFTEVFPTLKEAREAREEIDTFNGIKEELFSGRTENILKAVKGGDEKAFGKIVDDYIPALLRTDPAAGAHVMNNIIKTAIGHVFSHGEQIQNEDVKKAAIIFNQAIFGNNSGQPIQKFSKDDEKLNPEQERFNQERQQFAQERFNSTLTDLERRTDNVIKSAIDEHIDPKGAMSDFVKRTAVKEVMEEVDNLIADDEQFRKVLDNLWKNAAANGYNSQTVNKIRSAYLSKAQSLLPQLIQKKRAEALKGFGRGSSRTEPEKDRKGPLPRSGPSTSRNSGTPKSDGRGMKTVDFFNQD